MGSSRYKLLSVFDVALFGLKEPERTFGETQRFIGQNHIGQRAERPASIPTDIRLYCGSYLRKTSRRKFVTFVFLLRGVSKGILFE